MASFNAIAFYLSIAGDLPLEILPEKIYWYKVRYVGGGRAIGTGVITIDRAPSFTINSQNTWPFSYRSIASQSKSYILLHEQYHKIPAKGANFSARRFKLQGYPNSAPRPQLLEVLLVIPVISATRTLLLYGALWNEIYAIENLIILYITGRRSQIDSFYETLYSSQNPISLQSIQHALNLFWLDH